jgi:hypothetical protein
LEKKEPEHNEDEILTEATLDKLEETPLETASDPPTEPEPGGKGDGDCLEDLLDDAPSPASPESETARYTVEILSGPATGRKIRLNDETILVVGSGADADLVLDDECISHKHASFHFLDGNVTLEDMESTNGTFLRVVNRRALYPGEVIVIGNTVLRFGKE